MPTTRAGRTHKIRVAAVSLYVTVNRDESNAIREVFVKADEGHNAEADGLAIMASLAMRYGCPPDVVARHLRFRRYEPHGGPGQPCSISDAIGKVIEREVGREA
jgi:hypothetical protein